MQPYSCLQSAVLPMEPNFFSQRRMKIFVTPTKSEV